MGQMYAEIPIRLKANVRIRGEADRLVVSSEHSVHSFDDPLIARLLSLCRRPLLPRDVILALGGDFAAPIVERHMVELLARGVLTQLPVLDSASTTAYFDEVGQHFKVSWSLTLAVDWDRELVRQSLNALDLPLEQTGGTSALHVVLTDDYLREEVSSLLPSTIPMLLVKPVGTEVWLGPYLEPKATPCFECMSLWMSVRRWQSEERRSSGATPSTLAWGLGTLGMLLEQGRARELAACIEVLSTRTRDVSRFAIQPHPRCKLCSRTTAVYDGDVKVFASSPLSPIKQIQVSSHEWAGRFQARGSVYLPLPQGSARPPEPPTHMYGSGASREQAHETCLAEGLERYCTAFQGDEPLVRATARELPGLLAESLLFNPQESFRWAQVRSLHDSGLCYVPAGAAFLWYSFEGETRYQDPDSNGCAAGRTLWEAQLRALLELVERDALAIWWYNRVPLPHWNLESLGSSAIAAVKAALKGKGRDLTIFNLTHDIGIPVAAAISAKADGGEVVLASASGPTNQVAAERACFELLQILWWTDIEGPYPSLARWFAKAALSNQAFLNRSHEIYACQGEAPLTLETCLHKLEFAGLRAYWLDLTRAEIGVPVARVFVEGLRTHRRHLAPGRLYDVPVNLGWLPNARREEEMNPFESFI